MRSRSLLLGAVLLSACVYRQAPSSHATWAADPFKGQQALTSTPIVQPLRPGVAGPTLSSRLQYFEGEDSVLLLSTLITSSSASLIGLDCGTLEASLDGAPWPLAEVQHQLVLPAQVHFSARISFAQVAQLKQAHSLKLRVCSDVVEHTDSQLTGPDLWVFQDFATLLEERRGKKPAAP